jgi:hypothetical protein
MDIRITQTLVNRFYSVQFNITPTDDENKLINKYGDPDVNYGGVITWDDDDDIQTPEVTLFSLPDNWRKLRGGTGWTQKFDGNVDVDAQQKATEYARNIKARLATAVSTLRANNDTFSIVDTETV